MCHGLLPLLDGKAVPISLSRKNRPIFLRRWRKMPRKRRFGVSSQKKSPVFSGR